jgi:hypothetical protein
MLLQGVTELIFNNYFSELLNGTALKNLFFMNFKTFFKNKHDFCKVF